MRKALESDARFAVQVTPPDAIAEEVRRLAADGATRIVVSGGDGTIRTAAAAVAGTAIELAVIPGGTLNHFAKAYGIPTDVDKAIAVAAGSDVRSVDAAYVNDRLFLNTSSAGAYISFVRTRERLERWGGYHLASVIAGIATLARLHFYTVQIEVNGETRRYRTPLVFVGVGERELGFPQMGARVTGGRRGLHVMVARAHTRRALFRAALAAARGNTAEARRGIEEMIVDRCHISFPRPRGTVSVDGELVVLTAPLDYSTAPGAIRVVTSGGDRGAPQ